MRGNRGKSFNINSLAIGDTIDSHRLRDTGVLLAVLGLLAALPAVQNRYQAEIGSHSSAAESHSLRLVHAKELLGAQYHKSIVKYGEHVATLRTYVREKVGRSLQGDFQKHAESITRTIMEESKKYHFDPMFLVAVIESESSFRPHIIGTAGDIGLMQIRPTTAKWIAEKVGMEFKNKELLRNPVFNIQIGAAYLNMLRNKFNREGELYLAAYNMGSTNVKKNLNQSVVPKIYAGRVMKKYLRIYTDLKKVQDLRTAG